MKSVLILLLLSLITSYNYMAAVSTDELRGNFSESQSNYPKTSDEHSKIKKEKITWTPQLKSELLDLWLKTDPTSTGHTQRLHDEWSQKHKEYSHLKPKSLKVKAGRLIKTWRGPFDKQHETRLKILNNTKTLRWTKELKKSLIKCHDASLGCKGKLQQLWAQYNPEYAHLEPNYLMSAMHLFKTEPLKDDDDENEDPANLIWDGELKAELMNIWDETYSSDPKFPHKKRIFEEWKRRHSKYNKTTPENLKNFANSLIQQDTARRLARGENSETLQRRLEYMKRIQDRIHWTPKMISDLLNCWNDVYLGRPERLELWKKWQPEHANMTVTYLSTMASYFARIHHAAGRVGTIITSSENRGKQPEVIIGQDYGIDSRGAPLSHQSTVNQHTPHPLQFRRFEHEYSDTARGTQQLHRSTADQHLPYSPRFENPQHEHGESSRRTLPSQHASVSQHFSNIHHFKDSQYKHGGSANGTPRLHHSNTTSTTSHPYQPEDSHREYDANQESLKYQRLKRHTTDQKELQRSKSQKIREDLDLDLHLK